MMAVCRRTKGGRDGIGLSKGEELDVRFLFVGVSKLATERIILWLVE